MLLPKEIIIEIFKNINCEKDLYKSIYALYPIYDFTKYILVIEYPILNIITNNYKIYESVDFLLKIIDNLNIDNIIKTVDVLF